MEEEKLARGMGTGPFRGRCHGCKRSVEIKSSSHSACAETTLKEGGRHRRFLRSSRKLTLFLLPATTTWSEAATHGAARLLPCRAAAVGPPLSGRVARYKFLRSKIFWRNLEFEILLLFSIHLNPNPKHRTAQRSKTTFSFNNSITPSNSTLSLLFQSKLIPPP